MTASKPQKISSFKLAPKARKGVGTPDIVDGLDAEKAHKTKRKTNTSRRLMLATHKMLYEQKPAKVAMLEAGYTESFARTSGVKYTEYYRQEHLKFSHEMLLHRQEIMEQMRKEYKNAPYAALAMALDMINKVLSQGGANMFHDPNVVDPEVQKKVTDIICDNVEEHDNNS